MKASTVINCNLNRRELGEELAEKLLSENGPLISGEALWQTLGYRNAGAFRQAKAQKHLDIPVFNLPNRRGTFAFTQDVADWLKNLAKEVRNSSQMNK